MNAQKANSSKLYKLFPFLMWLKGYQPSAIRKDVLAGLTVAAV